MQERRRRWPFLVMLLFVMFVLLVFLAGTVLSPAKGEMSGSAVASEAMVIKAEAVEVLFDKSGWRDGRRHVEQKIMPRLFDMIERADDCIVLDMFLLNGFGSLPADVSAENRRDLSHDLIKALAEKKRRSPEIFILFVTDPINAVYSARCPPAFKELAAAGGSVVCTDLRQMPDSNLVYSPFYRVARPFMRYVPGVHKPLMQNPFGGRRSPMEKVGIAQLAALLNFKANHRKVALIKNGDSRWEALVTSANPHTASSLHGNVAVHLTAGPLTEMVRSEYLIARASVLSRPEYCFGGLSAPELTRELEKRLGRLAPVLSVPRRNRNHEPVTVQYLTEFKIAQKLDWMLAGVEKGDEVSVAMFYLADPKVVEGLIVAAGRGARVRLILDPNKDAFGREKGGIPNRVVAEKLLAGTESDTANLEIRWFDTHGEQAHYKMLRVNNSQTGKEQLLIGSANFTNRNLRGYNLEAAVYLSGGQQAGREVGRFFEEVWDNRNGTNYTVEAETYGIDGMSYVFGSLKEYLGTKLGLGTY